MDRFVRAPGVVTRRIAGELVLVPTGGLPEETMRTVRFFVLNRTAEAIWDLLASPQSAESLARHLTAEYEIDYPQALADAGALLEDLRQNASVVRAED
jgi:hypothetical protein